MKNYSDITENLDITTKQYVDSGFMPKTGGIFTGDVTITPGHFKTDLIKSADDSKWIAEFTAAGLELGGSGYALRFYSNTRPVVANQNKELAYTSDIPDISGKQDIITESNKLSASLVSGLAQVATTGDYNDLSNTPTVLSEADIKGIKVNNAANADSAGSVKNSIVCQGVGMNADANYSNFVTYDGSAARSLKFFKYDFQMQDALGSGNAELTLRNTGVTAGTYNSVTVDAKGRVTAGTNTPVVDTDNFVPKSAFSLSGTTLTITI